MPAVLPTPETSATRLPHDLPRLIMRRALVVVVLGMLLGLILGLLRLQSNVRDELEAARVLALLTERLATLPTMDDGQARLALRQWCAEGPLRHLSLRLLDSHGQALWDDCPAPADTSGPASALEQRLMAVLAPPSFTVSWALPRPVGPPWVVALSAEPDSEQREALLFVLESATLLAGVGLGMLVVMTWNTRRAFAPLATMLQAIARLPSGDRAALLALPAMPVREMEAIASALRQLASELAQAEAEQRHLGQQVLSLQEDERQRLAAELHDEFGQGLTALRVDAAWLQRQLADRPAAQAVAAGMAGQCERIQQDIRAVLQRLQPLGHPGEPAGGPDRLAELLHRLVQGWHRTGHTTRPQITLTLQRCLPHGELRPWPDPAELPTAQASLSRELLLTLYRITQEALTNVHRHAQASQVEVRLCWYDGAHPEERPVLAWSVSDDGGGLPDPAAALRRGSGLAGIKERIWAQGGDLAIAPAQADAARPGLCLSARLQG